VGKVTVFAAVSLDGYVGRDDDMPGPLFDWYGNGDVEMTVSDENRVFRVTQATADLLRSEAPGVAVMVCGRRLFDLTDGWEGVPPDGEHVFVVTHRPADGWAHAGTAPFTFVPGVRSAIEQATALAGDRDVSVAARGAGSCTWSTTSGAERPRRPALSVHDVRRRARRGRRAGISPTAAGRRAPQRTPSGSARRPGGRRPAAA
jgi:dihydrofolate reductase